MLGIDDPWVLAGYLLCAASAVLCVAYGLVCWNRGQQETEPQDVAWAKKEKAVEEEL
jgi:hypothetical protein